MGFYDFAKDKGILRYMGIVHDLIVVTVAVFFAYATAYGPTSATYIPDFGLRIFAFTLVYFCSAMVFSVSQGSWRYVSIPDLLTIIKASLVAVIIYTLAAFLISRSAFMPRSVPILTFIFLVVGLAVPRLIYRLSVERITLGEPLLGRLHENKRFILLYGMNDEADSFIRSSRRHANDGTVVVGVLDDHRSVIGRKVQGVKVLGALADLGPIMERLTRRGINITELLITEDVSDRERLGEIVEAATSQSIIVSRLPGASERSEVREQGSVARKRIELGDLLGRPEVCTDLESVARLVNGKIAFISGAGGSIGSELARQIASFAPRLLVVTDNSEFQLFTLDLQLRESFPDLPIIARIMDIRDTGRIAHLFEAFRPDVVFHAAALKHVPFVEDNPLEGIKTNLIGTRNLADAALAFEALTFVMISTDKAVNPTNIMGATKRAAESYCQSLDMISQKTRFKTVRFGNVLGSNGSVVPRFEAQIARGGPVTVTHPRVIRYFMTIPEAVSLVLHASAHGSKDEKIRGKIMVLDMGKPIRIVDLAERMIQLAGFKPRIDIEITFTGLRQGEKLYEELFDPSEVQNAQTDDGYFIASPRSANRAFLARAIDEISDAANQEESSRALQILFHLVPEYRDYSGDKSVLDHQNMNSGETKTY